MSMMVSFVLSFFPRDVLDEILNLIESVSEDFLTTLSLSVHLYLRIRRGLEKLARVGNFRSKCVFNRIKIFLSA